jgi:hypothetical protein
MSCPHIWKLTGLAGGGLHTQYECELCEQLTWMTLGRPDGAEVPPPLTIVKEEPVALEKW